MVNETRDTGIKDWSAFIGEGPKSYDLGYQPAEANSGYAHMLLNTSSGEDNQMVIDKLYAWCFRHLPDADVKVKRLSGGGGSGVPVQIRVWGNCPAELFNISEKISVDALLA
ncbi:MAG: hypothetical protein GY950_25470, partial [bacterium]|nr:hypothetical protein [bacterium]